MDKSKENSSEGRRDCAENFWDKMDETWNPEMETVSSYVNNALWEELCNHLEERYQVKPVFSYSKCSMQPGWNVKYKKSGRALCTLYPFQKEYRALVVIGEREKAEMELALPTFTPYLRQLYRDTTEGMGQKWLMIHVTDHAILEDVKKCVDIRRTASKNS